MASACLDLDDDASFEAAGPEPLGGEDDWGLPGLELQHDLHLTLKHWSSVGAVAQTLSDAGAEVHALSLSRHADNCVLRCRVKSISARRARELADALRDFLVGSASVEHLMLTKGGAHAGCER
jgi:hypothetical protein